MVQGNDIDELAACKEELRRCRERLYAVELERDLLLRWGPRARDGKTAR